MVIRTRHVREWQTIIAVLMSALTIMTMITICLNTEYRQDLQPIVVQQAAPDNDSMQRLADMAELFIGFEYGP